MTKDLSDLQFWLALAVNLVALGFFVRWLCTGGRGPRRPPENRTTRDPGF